LPKLKWQKVKSDRKRSHGCVAFTLLLPRYFRESLLARRPLLRQHQLGTAGRIGDGLAAGVGGNLFRDRQMHRQVQERIRLAAFDGRIARHGFLRVPQLVVVFGMLLDPVGGFIQFAGNLIKSAQSYAV
jgi:hypothetical protein